MDLTPILISHDLAVVQHFCEHVAVMRDGRLVEFGPKEQIFAAPRESCTCVLLAAIPRIGRRQEMKQEAQGPADAVQI